jgi:hypothetical protein
MNTSATVIGLVSRSSAIEALGWTLLHFLWQGTAVSLMLAVFFGFGRRLSPQARYAAGCAALALMTLSAGATFVWQISGVVPEREAQNDSMASIAPIPTNTGFERVVAEAGSGVNVAIDKNLGSDRNLAAVGRLENAGETAGRRVEMVDEPAASPIQRLDISARRFEFLADGLRPWLRWLVGLWGAGVGLLSLCLAHGWRTIRRVRVSARELTDPVWTDRFARLHERLGVSTPVRLLGSASASVPMVIGWLKPVVLVPAGMLTGLSAAQIEALLVHELAHIRRHDYIVNLLQNVLETLFFYHPAVWWVSAQIRKEREHCCDDVAAGACGVLDYAQALASLAEIRHMSPGFGLAANSAPVVDRIRRLAGDAIPGRPVGWLAVPVILVLGTCFGLLLSTRSGADEQQKTGLTAGTPPPPAKPAVVQVLLKVAGRVVDHEGEPVAAARLWWLVPNDEPMKRFRTVAECSSDASGHFQVEAPFELNAPRGTLGQLWVLAPGKNWTVDNAPQRIDRLAAKGVELAIRLEPATDIEFQVNDADGRRVPGAIVENDWDYFHAVRFASCGLDVHPIEPEIPAAVRAVWRTTADAAGRAHLHSLRDVLDIKVTSPEFGTQVIRRSQDEGSLKRTIQLRQTGRVEGRVLAADPRSVGGIKIWLRTWMSPETFISAGWSGIEGTGYVTTDAAGRFSVPAIAEGELILRVLDWPGSSTLSPKIPQGLTVTAGKTTRAEIRLEPSVAVEGLVRTKDRGQPIAGVRISLRPFDSDRSFELTSDANGRYQARVLPGSVWMSSMIPDEIAAHYVQSPFHSMRSPFPFYVSPSSQEVRVKPTPNGQPFQLPVTVFTPAKSVKGTVIDVSGRPLSHAAVQGDAREGRYWASTNPGGEFELHVPERVMLASYDVCLRDRLVTDVTIEKRDPLVLKVKSISATGGYEFSHPKKDTIQAQWASALRAAQVAQADSATRATQVQKSSGPTPKSTLVSPKPPTTAPSPAMRKIAGRVVDHEGNRVAAARLWWVVLESFSQPRAFTVAGTSDAEGRFEMQAPSDWKPDPPSRRCADSLWILAPGKELKVVVATDGLIHEGKPPSWTVQIESATGTTFYQVNDLEGRPVAGAILDAPQFEYVGATLGFPDAVRDQLRITTDKSGRARLHSIPRSFFTTVLVTAPGFGTQRLGPRGDHGLGDVQTLTLRPAGRIEGRLEAEDPRAVRGVRILFETQAAPRDPWGEAIVATDDTGRFVIPAIAEGQVRINFLDDLAKFGFLPRVPSSLTLDAGHTLNVDMQMVRPILVKGSIRTQDTEQPVVGAEICVGFQQWDTVISDAQGRYEAHVLPGSVHMQVIDMPPKVAARYTEMGEAMSSTVEVPKGATPFELPPIFLTPTETVAGTLIDRIGRRLANARVCGIGGKRRYGCTLTNAEGEFAVQLPKQISVDSFEVWLPDQAETVKSVKIMKYRPLVLCVESFSQPEARQRETGDKHLP